MGMQANKPLAKSSSRTGLAESAQRINVKGWFDSLISLEMDENKMMVFNNDGF